MSSKQCMSAIDADSLVRSVISKMMYTCTNPYCKHRVSTCSSRSFNHSHSTHYNCPGFPRLNGSLYRNHLNQEGTSFPCGCFVDNPEESSGIERSRLSKSKYSGMCLSCMPAAGDFEREQERGRWVNNSLHNGTRMKKTIYESENPRAYVQSGPFGKNYDIQYQIQEERIRRTPAKSPEGRTKISSLVRRDRDRKQ